MPKALGLAGKQGGKHVSSTTRMMKERRLPLTGHKETVGKHCAVQWVMRDDTICTGSVPDLEFNQVILDFDGPDFEINSDGCLNHLGGHG